MPGSMPHMSPALSFNPHSPTVLGGMSLDLTSEETVAWLRELEELKEGCMVNTRQNDLYDSVIISRYSGICFLMEG